ncbi:hypothetical protein Cgig2_005612 [Carnegiea gigantea]|uniref:Uncharacterized protein n=1 Tax=Carnegiea gigantea TaxID=171969 RepID=A0A9Q1KV31_9CARY|nr:hypothetical protein Cgig2_005612 [Carnegiea gigantea]
MCLLFLLLMLSTKEADLIKDGLNAEKSSCSAEQSPGPAKGDKITSPAGDTDAPGSSDLHSDGLDQSPKLKATPFSSSSSKNHAFKFGKPALEAEKCRMIQIGGPTFGMRGRVVLAFEDNPMSKIGVRFDKYIPGGVDLGILCEVDHGFFCNVHDLRLENPGMEDLDKLLINSLFEAIYNESRNFPFILFIKDVEKSTVGNSESYSTFKSRLDKLPDNVVVIGSHTQADNRKEKVLSLFRLVILLGN